MAECRAVFGAESIGIVVAQRHCCKAQRVGAVVSVQQNRSTQEFLGLRLEGHCCADGGPARHGPDTA